MKKRSSPSAIWLVLLLALAGLVPAAAQTPTYITSGTASLPITFKGRVYYSTGSEVWSTDGTPAGTSVFSAVPQVSLTLFWHPLIVFNGRLYFSYNDPTVGEELWSTDGTTAGTRLVKDIYPGGALYSRNDGSPVDPVIAGNRLFFKAMDSGTPSSGNKELWSTDGTTAGTVKLTNANSPRVHLNADDTEVLNGKLIFRIEQSNNDAEVWASDGTPAGTVKLTTTPGNRYSITRDMQTYGNYVYFTHHTTAAGHQLWRTNGTPAGTQLFFTAPGGDGYPDHFNLINNRLVFSTYINNSRKLWHTDGTTAGTQQLADVEPYVGAKEFTLFNGRYYFAGVRDAFMPGSAGSELWATDGTTAGTQLVKDLNPGSGSGIPDLFKVAGTQLFFTAVTAASGRELWVTDGTAANTRQISEIGPGNTDGYAFDLFRFNNKVVFTGRPATSNYQLYESDGTTAGTRLLAPANATTTFGTLTSANGPYSGPERLFGTGTDVFFSARFTNSHDLYRLGSGTFAPLATRAAAPLNAVTAYPNPLAGTLHLRWTGTAASAGPLTATLFDALGRPCLTAPWASATQPLTLPLPQLAAGIYWLELRDASGLRARQRLVQP
ncbi:hypothetical protein Q5H93_20550 [Hymenobacter sp. ASUV-10]|uniref:T9SS type A sorting domain-containing protein n=1 Tax=Hymenobacter aranciens TaxID=3063996 RepID=A0ABT9BHK2_9BACT|nr:hypothetical protein [Hymenobacter sp. ASUV-10]MDO7877148.1 hypothetical protein [Hymenobacter sp. ASUV-10]